MPVPMEHIIERLLQSAGGQIVACNIVAGIENGLIDQGWATEVLTWMGTLATHQNYTSFVQALDDLRTHQHPLAAVLPDIRIGSIDAPAAFEVEVSCVLRMGTVLDLMSSQDKQRLSREGLKTRMTSTDPSAKAMIEEWQSKPASARTVRFDPMARLGHHPHDVIWFTRRDALEDALASDDKRGCAQRARDLLGLVHHQQGTMLAAMHFRPPTLSACISARPTFADAGSNARFKTWPDSQAARRERSWGSTVDLHALGASHASVDGCPERTTQSIDGTVLSNDATFEFELLGAVEISSGQGDNADADFLKRLLNGRTIAKLRETLAAQLV